MNIICFFKGHDWEFTLVAEDVDRIGLVQYKDGICKRCGETDKVLCFVCKKKEIELEL